ncbi:MAG: hypothetical protein R2717_07785 [Schumannella sp.]
MTIRSPDADAVAAHLASEGIHVWGGRACWVSPYIYNTPEDLERFVERLAVPDGHAA